VSVAARQRILARHLNDLDNRGYPTDPMNGFSVDEAAEVLGIPQGRIWELIARGVLAGAAEVGGSMRVYLKGEPGQAIPMAGTDTEARTNGNGHRTNGEAHAELSPFRELLTEFRNLTERYGQALLALGEARGEVAALRSRVDLLEARMDMRLPVRPASTVAWEMPDLPARQREPAPVTDRPPEPAAQSSEADASAPEQIVADQEPEAEAPFADTAPMPELQPEEAQTIEASEPDAAALDSGSIEYAPAEEAAEPQALEQQAAELQAAELGDHPEPIESEPRARRWSSREAVANLTEALARAEDPTLASLPGAREAADALAALRHQVEAAGAMPDLPAEAPLPEEADEGVDDTLPVDLDGLAVAAPEIERADETFVAEVEALVADDVAEPPAEEEQAPEPFAAQAPDAEPMVAEPMVAEAMPEAPEVDERGDEPEAPPVATSAYPSDTYTTDVIEPDWFADGDFSWLDAAAAEASAHEATEVDAAGSEPAAEAPADEPDRPSREAESEAPVADEIQEAFEAPARAEPFRIEVDEPRPPDAGSGSEWPRHEGPEARADGEVAGFGLYRGQPERPSAERPTTGQATAVRGEEALMWFGDEFDADELEVAAPGWRDEERRPQPPATPAPIQLSDDEIEQLASAEGWEREEVDALRGLLGRPQPAPDTPAPDAQPEPVPPAAPPIQVNLPVMGRLPELPAETGQPSPDWLRGRRGPAANTYRRLRRIFQG